MKKKVVTSTDIVAIPKTKIITSVFTKDTAEYKRVPYGVFFLVVVFCMAALFITFLSVRINSVQSEISELNSTLGEIRFETASAKYEIYRKRDYTDIKNRAEELGMVTVDKLPKHYMYLDLPDVVKVLDYEEEEEKEFSFAVLLSAVNKSFDDFVKYISEIE